MSVYGEIDLNDPLRITDDEELFKSQPEHFRIIAGYWESHADRSSQGEL